MDYCFSDRVKTLNPSAIREILKYAADPEVVSFSAGNPAPEAFPVETIAAISSRLFAESPIDALQYSTTEGYAPLRAHLKRYMREKHGVGGEEDDILITAGAQQVMELAVKVLCNPGDTVICESPSFIGSLNSFRSLGGKLVGVPMEDDGMDMAALEQALQQHQNVRFIYTIANFQNPSGITMSADKRRQLLALAKRYNVLILEDNPYGDLRYTGEDVPAIKSMDEDGRVLYAGSFSKVLAPGIRVGFAIAPKAIIQKMVVCKQGEDVHTTIWSQMLCDRFMKEYDYEAHLERLRAVYREKAERMLTLLGTHLAPYGITHTPVEGGLFIWCRLPDEVDMPAFCKQAVVDYKVAIIPGNAFLTDESAVGSHFRLNFSAPTDEEMTIGMERLGKLASTLLA